MKDDVRRFVDERLGTSRKSRTYLRKHYSSLKRLIDYEALDDDCVRALITKFGLLDTRGRPSSVETFRHDWKTILESKQAESKRRADCKTFKTGIVEAVLERNDFGFQKSTHRNNASIPPRNTMDRPHEAETDVDATIDAIFSEYRSGLSPIPIVGEQTKPWSKRKES